VGAYDAILTHVAVGRERVAVWQVRDLESHVDRDALLRGEHPSDPPYWAHLWSGARLLAAAIPSGRRRVIELGCGLGLPALTAARRGAEVVAVDRMVEPLAFVRASARAAALDVSVAVGDFRDVAFRRSFDLVLLAEVLYDRSAFVGLVRTLDRLLAADGTALLADGYRIDTREFYTALRVGGFGVRSAEFVATEEGFPVRVLLSWITRATR